MRMPWQRRRDGARSSGEPASDGGASDAIAVRTAGAWRSLPVIRGAASADPPLTARSAEMADTLARRMRSLGTRPALVHRSGLPDPAAHGTVRGLATVASASRRDASSERRSDGVPTIDDAEYDRGDALPAPVTAAPKTAARRPGSGRLTGIDAALAATLDEAMRPVMTAPDEPEPPAAAVMASEAAPEPSLPQRSQRTVVRRRIDGARPLGLQPPLQRPSGAEAVRSADEAPLPELQVAPAAERPARAVAAAVGRLHRVDVSDVRVQRGDEARRMADEAKARAATRGGEVYIPAAEGDLEQGRASGLLAHELTHVIQQRRLGRSVPLEHSPAGRRLEAEAVMTERHVRGDLGAPPPPPAAEPPARAPEPAASTPSDEAAAAIARDIQEELVASGRALRTPDGSLVFPGGGGHLPEQRSEPAQPGVPVQHAGEEGVAPPAAAVAAATGPFQVAPSTPRGTAAPPPPALAPSVPGPVFVNAAPAPAPAASPAFEAPAPVAAVAANSSAAGEDATAPGAAAPEVDLDDLARRVYGRVRTRLRTELLIDRERAGLLTDFR